MWSAESWGENLLPPGFSGAPVGFGAELGLEPGLAPGRPKPDLASGPDPFRSPPRSGPRRPHLPPSHEPSALGPDSAHQVQPGSFPEVEQVPVHPQPASAIARKNKGINFFTVKYKKAGKSFYLTTRSVPPTNKKNFNLAPGHSEERFKLIRKAFQQKHGLKKSHLQYGATEREPCGVGPGMANCRGTLSGLGIPKDKIFFASPYPDRTAVVSPPNSSLSAQNTLASTERKKHATAFGKDIDFIHGDADSDTESEDEADVVDEYEEDYGEKAPKFRKRINKKLTGKAFRF